MKTLFTAEVLSQGGRSGRVDSTDGLLKAELGNPLEVGRETRGPNPEMLFAAAYSACYHGALGNAAKKAGHTFKNSEVRARVSLLEDDDGGYHLGIELHALLPGVDYAEAETLMKQAHKTCPYSKALRGDANIILVVDEQSAGTPAFAGRD